jgi:glucose-6-phosphate dehydrogenase assembly protein OpcA
MSAAPPTPSPLIDIPKAVDVAKIESELARLWHAERTDEEDNSRGVTRVCMSNLIIFSEDPEAMTHMAAEIGEVVRQHPSRALLLVGEPAKAKATISAHVSAYAHMIGNNRQVCSELVTVTATGDATRRLPSAARSLLLGELPTSLWWASPTPPPLASDLFTELSAMADQVIYESLGWLDPVHNMIAVADWAAKDPGEQLIADLSWRRLKMWRRIISQGLDPTVMPGAQQSITEIRMEHGPHGLPQAWLLVSWLARRLGWQTTGGKVKLGKEITWNFLSPRSPVKITICRLPEGDPLVKSISITWPSPERKPITAHFASVGERLVVTWDDPTIPPRTLAAPPMTRAYLVAKQLPDRDSDMLFRNTLQVCKRMAEALV